MSHGNIRKRIHTPGHQKQRSYRRRTDAEYLRIEYHKKRAGQHKEKIIAEVAKHITDLIPETKFSFHVTCPLLKVNLSLSIKKLYHKCRKILRIIFVVISTIFVFYGIIQKKCSINIML